MRPDELRFLLNTMPALQNSGEDVWIADGAERPRFVSASLPTRMIIVKLGDGSLWINSTVAVSRETLDQIDVIGPVRYLVAPRALHIWRLQAACRRLRDRQQQNGLVLELVTLDDILTLSLHSR